MIENIIHSNQNFATTILEELLSKIEVAEDILLVVVVRETDVLMIGCISRKGKARTKYPFHRCRSRMTEIIVDDVLAKIRLCDAVPRLIISASPRERKVDIFGDIAAYRKAEGVADIVCLVDAEIVICNICE